MQAEYVSTQEDDKKSVLTPGMTICRVQMRMWNMENEEE
jgi:hypothetical protein